MPKRRLAGVLAAIITINIIFADFLCISARAEVDWPYPAVTIDAEGAIVMDADTHAVLWGRNQDTQYCPASITKLMTALLVLENCALTEQVTITADAVYNLESGATTASLSVDDVLSVEDLLYALLLKSANDAANALAIYVSGSIADFAALMNRRAAELGCLHTDFRNPSGLTDDEHLTTAYDMALIMSACLEIPEFLEIESHDTWKMGPTAKYPSGLTVTMGHKMLRSGTDYSDDRVIAGKTGFITASGNTLVTAAADDETGRTVITVCLKDEMPKHYTDTQKLLEFGFTYFDNHVIDDPEGVYGAEERLEADKIISGGGNHIIAGGDAVVTLPKGADTADITEKYDYNLNASAPELACALLKFYYDSRNVGSVYLLNDRESELIIEGADYDKETAGAHDKKNIDLVSVAAAVFAALVVLGLVIWKLYTLKAEKQRMDRLRQRRLSRIESMGMSEDEFGELVRKNEEQRRERRGGRKSDSDG